MKRAKFTVGGLMIAVMVVALATWLLIGLGNVRYFSKMALKHDTAIDMKSWELDRIGYFVRRSRFVMPRGLTAEEQSRALAQHARILEIAGPQELTESELARQEQLERELEYERKMLSRCQYMVWHPWSPLPAAPETPMDGP